MYQALFTPPWPSLVYAAYNYAVTIPAGARNIVIRQDPFTHNNLIGRSTLVSLAQSTLHHSTPPSVALC